MWRGIATATIGSVLALSLSACGGSSSRPSAKYDGQEVKDVNCDPHAHTVITQMVNGKGLKGTMEMRESTKCPLLYWLRFTPNGNKRGFVVTVSIGDLMYKQASVPHKPEVAAWTRGIAATKDETVRGCVKATGQGSKHDVCFDVAAA